MLEKIKNEIRSGLIVSCQAEDGDPFNTPEGVTLFARAAVMGGAVGIRSRELEKTAMIVKHVNVPVIGLTKALFSDGFVRITGSYAEVEAILKSGCHIVAIDGTFREREGITGPQFITKVKERFGCLVMADISTYDDGIACADHGADFISTTLSGYTPETKSHSSHNPDFELVRRLASQLPQPVIAEGRVSTPVHALQMLELGAWAVVVGTAITRPRVITEWYVNKMKRSGEKIEQ